MSDAIAVVAVVVNVLFVVTMVLANRPGTQVVGEYVGIVFHLLLLAVIGALPVAPVAQSAGVAWVLCDVVAGTGLIWSANRNDVEADAVFAPVRWAGHLFAAIWIATVSLGLGLAGIAVGLVLALGFAAYTLAAGRLSPRFLALPGVLMVVWLALVAWHLHAATR